MQLLLQTIPEVNLNTPRESRPRGADCVFSSSEEFGRPRCAERPQSPREQCVIIFKEVPRDGSLQKWYLGR